MLARRFLAQHRDAEPVVLVVTDGEPTAHLEDDGTPFFCWPPMPETIARTVAEVERVARTGATVNVFALDPDPGLVHFVHDLTQRAGGRVFSPTATGSASTSSPTTSAPAAAAAARPDAKDSPSAVRGVGLPTSEEGATMPRTDEEALTRLEKDPEFRAATTRWRECARRSGVQAPDPPAVAAGLADTDPAAQPAARIDRRLQGRDRLPGDRVRPVGRDPARAAGPLPHRGPAVDRPAGEAGRGRPGGPRELMSPIA